MLLGAGHPEKNSWKSHTTFKKPTVTMPLLHRTIGRIGFDKEDAKLDKS